MNQVRVAVLSGFGINCETETMAVFEMAGATAVQVHVNRLVNGEMSLDDYHIMAVPGGFSFGDHLGSCLLYTSPSPRDVSSSRMPSSA